MSENFSFRSSMNGFNRNDVIAYIDNLLSEKAALESKIQNFEKQIEEIKANCDAEIVNYKNTVLNSAIGSEATISRLEKEVAELKEEGDTLREIIASAAEKEKLKELELAAERELLKAKENQLVAEIENAKTKALQFEKDKEAELLKQTDKCADCEIVKVYEARLGAAMLDAKRFSEILVKEANDKASDLFADAFSSAEATSAKAGAIADNITEISNQFNVSFKVLLDNMYALGKTLDSFKSDIKLTGEKFDFTTDFAAVSGEEVLCAKKAADSNADEAVKEDIIPVRKVNINFDDADEYDFRVDVND